MPRRFDIPPMGERDMYMPMERRFDRDRDMMMRRDMNFMDRPERSGRPGLRGGA